MRDTENRAARKQHCALAANVALARQSHNHPKNSSDAHQISSNPSHFNAYTVNPKIISNIFVVNSTFYKGSFKVSSRFSQRSDLLAVSTCISLTDFLRWLRAALAWVILARSRTGGSCANKHRCKDSREEINLHNCKELNNKEISCVMISKWWQLFARGPASCTSPVVLTPQFQFRVLKYS